MGILCGLAAMVHRVKAFVFKDDVASEGGTL
jgi:hypothetical protein